MIDSRLNEVDCDTGIIFDDIEDFKHTVKLSFKNKHQSYNSWEAAVLATL